MNSKIPWDLIVYKLKGSLSVEDEARFLQWLAIDDNQPLFHQLESVWQNIQNKTASYEPDMEYYWHELSSRMEKFKKNKAMQFEALAKPKIPFFRSLYQKVAAAAILTLALGAGAYYLMQAKANQEAIAQTYSSITGKSKIILPDGTQVWLHSHTTIVYNKSLNAQLREVHLDGEAYFDVKHDAKPFMVHAGDLDIKVHGTKFNVNSYESSKKIIVSLDEGLVSMTTTGLNIFLKPGEEAFFDKQNKAVNIEQGDTGLAKIWTQDKIRFENKNLREVCSYLSKWYGAEIMIDPSIPDSQSYTFTLTSQSLEEVIQTMANISSISYSIENDKIIIRNLKK
ncbi:MAG: FecR family protein [Dysgonamonadaceae bacterium]|jgi:ferric-dicitrate binding protein FerR (iron transport regulator)|nr:FecR family protein [Dysgonamonadaceae bacterium]